MKSVKHLMLLFPVVFLIHDIEEIVTVEQFELPVPITISSAQFTLAFIILWLIVTWGCISAAKNQSFLGMNPITTFSLIICIFLANGIGHVVQSIIFLKYVPGVVNAVVLLIPYCLFSLKRLRDEELITEKGIAKNLLVGIAIFVPAICIALVIGKFIL